MKKTKGWIREVGKPWHFEEDLSEVPAFKDRPGIRRTRCGTYMADDDGLVRKRDLESRDQIFPVPHGPLCTRNGCR